MQVTPALPWGTTTEGGVIKLKKAVTYNDLRDGILRWTLDKNDTDEVGQIVAGEVGDRKLYVANSRGDKVYTIAAFTDPTNQLTLTRHADAPADTSLKSAVFPAVIAPLGDIQLFKDRFGYEYANGSLSTVYARVNNPWESPFSIGNGSVWQNSMSATAPTAQSPNNKYSLSIWVDFTSEEFNSIQAGQIIPCSNGSTAEDVTNAQKIFNAHDPLPVEGDVQVFADSSQLTIPAGQVNKLYARVNKAWGYGEDWHVGNREVGIICSAPSDHLPDDPYAIYLYLDFSSADSAVPYNDGDIVECPSQQNVDVTGKPYVFSKPEP